MTTQRQSYAPQDMGWLGYDWFKLGLLLLLLLLLLALWWLFGGPPAALPRLTAPTLAAPVAGASLAPGQLTFSGAGTPGSTVQVTVDGQPVGTAVVGSDGAWSLQAPVETVGERQVAAQALGTDGRIAASGPTVPVTVSAPPIAAPTLDLPQAAVLPGQVELGGSGTPGSTVQVTIGGQPVGTATVGADGRWKLSATVAAGTLAVVAQALDASGTVAAQSQPGTLTVAALPAITSLASGATVPAGTLRLEGTGAPGSTVEVLEGTTVLGTATVGANGRWELEYDAVPGSLVLTARPQGGTAASTPVRVTVDALPAITSLASGATVPAGTLRLEGTGAPGSTVEVMEGTTVLGTATVGANGRWELEYDAAPGSLVLTARPQGSTAAAQPVRVTVAALPAITSLASGATVSAGTLTLGGTGAPGSTVEVLDGTTVLGTATVGANGRWEFEYDAAPGSLVLTARTRGDTTASTPVRVTVNPAAAQSGTTGGTQGTTATPPAITSLASGATVPAGTLTLGGTGAPGSTIEVLDGTTVLGTATVGANGRWELEYDAAPGSLVLTARPQGSTAASTPVRVTVNPAAAQSGTTGGTQGTTATPPAITSLASGATVPAGTLTLGGTGAPGSTVEVLDGTTVLGTATVGASGRWEFEYDAAPGSLVLTARPQGSTAASTPVRVTVNPAAAQSGTTTGGTTTGGTQGTAANLPVITSLASGATVPAGTLTLGGTGAPGSTVEVLDGTTVLGTATVGANGRWELEYDAAPGSLVLTARPQGSTAASTPVRVTVNPAAAQSGTTGTGGGTTAGSGANAPAALPRTGGTTPSMVTLAAAALAAALLGAGLLLRHRARSGEGRP